MKKIYKSLVLSLMLLAVPFSTFAARNSRRGSENNSEWLQSRQTERFRDTFVPSGNKNKENDSSGSLRLGIPSDDLTDDNATPIGEALPLLFTFGLTYGLYVFGKKKEKV
ncbi:MAG: hypothetical protein EZS26_001990 [Candidatus Ordinivivax streblomastigis]|uniref:Uncharacterized protein n=1 Tax=Candidatus Ordinivivax streblomastigis TaxID=2540710 RepID=A0A5M8P071_9BACT|nr:MAG: hypothetical protein EZS26_001990 [Candidatus Ordinivivax streblomastigis]